MSVDTERALQAVRVERLRQHDKWGQQDVHPFEWIAILAEEVGEFAEACLAYNSDQPELHGGGDPAARMRKEAVQVAAVAVQIVEYLDRHDIGTAL